MAGNEAQSNLNSPLQPGSLPHISTHILDQALGVPASRVPVELFFLNESGNWDRLESHFTNTDGRVQFQSILKKGSYKIQFSILEYYKSQNKTLGVDTFFLNPEIGFRIEDTTRKYHVPLLLSPFGFSTYRGS